MKRYSIWGAHIKVIFYFYFLFFNFFYINIFNFILIFLILNFKKVLKLHEEFGIEIKKDRSNLSLNLLSPNSMTPPRSPNESVLQILSTFDMKTVLNASQAISEVKIYFLNYF